MKIKIGDKVIVKKNISDNSDYWESCNSRDADYLVITTCISLGRFYWDAYKDGKKIDHCAYHNLTANDFLPYKREIQDVQYGDLIVDKGGDYRRVLGRVNDAVFVTLNWKKGEKEKTGSGGTWSIQDLKDNGFTIIQEEESELETITIDGKTYNKKEFDERLKELKEIKS